MFPWNGASRQIYQSSRGKSPAGKEVPYLSYEDRQSTRKKGVWKAIRRGLAQEVVCKHRDGVTGDWKQISKQRRHVNVSYDNGFTMIYLFDSICFYYWKQYFRTFAWRSVSSNPYGFKFSWPLFRRLRLPPVAAYFLASRGEIPTYYLRPRFCGRTPLGLRLISACVRLLMSCRRTPCHLTSHCHSQLEISRELPLLQSTLLLPSGSVQFFWYSLCTFSLLIIARGLSRLNR